MSFNSLVSPEFDNNITTSSGVIIPRSPWLASPGWIKNDGVPVEARVAAILLPIWPDLPMPLIIILPWQFVIRSIALIYSSPKKSKRASRPLISVEIVCLAEVM